VSSSSSRRGARRSRRRSRRPSRAIVIVVVLLAVFATAAVAVSTTGLGLDDDRETRNVILFIGDGMGDSEITSARNYEYGSDGRLPGIDALPHDGRFTVHSLTRNGEPDYVADSAAAATAWATGQQTYDGAIGVDVDGAAHPTLLELAKKKGLRTGNVTTASVQDATPAAQMAHVAKRSCQEPEDTSDNCPENALESGGKGSISEQVLTTRPDVVLGGGLEIFEDEEAESGEFAGVTLLDQAERRGFQVVQDQTALAAVDEADQKAPLLGLFADGHLPVDWVGPKATRTGGKTPAVRCATPVIAAIATGSESLVTDGVTGRLIRPGAIDLFCEALAHYCTDEDARRAAGEAGFQASQRYGWDAVNHELAEAYMRVIRQHNEGGRQQRSPVP